MPFGLKFLFIVIGSWCVLLSVLFRFEKRWVWPYGALESVPRIADEAGYSLRWVPDALSEGFAFLGWAPDIKGPTYKLTNAMLVSTERDIYVVMCIGKIINIPVGYTLLLTPASDGRVFYSASHLSGLQMDVSRHWTNHYVPTNSFRALLTNHKKWLKSEGISPQPFVVGTEYDQFRALRSQHFRTMEQGGIIFFTDSSQEQFHFTAWGATRTAIKGYFWGIARQITQGRFPRNG